MLMRSIRTACFVALLLIGCDSVEEGNSTEISESYARWKAQGIKSYSIVQDRHCYCAGPTFVELHVSDGRVVEVLNPETHEVYEVENPDVYLTVDEVFERLEEYELQTPARFNVNLHPEYGYPAEVNVDPDSSVADEEFVMTLSDFNPLID